MTQAITDVAAMFDSAWPITYTAPGEDPQDTRAIIDYGKGEETDGAVLSPGRFLPSWRLRRLASEHIR